MLKRYLIPHEGNSYHPHFFRNTVVGFIIALVLIFLGLSFAVSLRITENKNFLGAIYATALVDLTNKDRANLALPTLTISETLTLAAQLKADDMVQNGYFAHNSPDGKTPWFWILKSGYKFVYAGENLAVNFTESEQVETAWMGSPTHRANILNNNYSEVGIAVREGTFEGRNATFVVQMFGKPTKTKTAFNSPVPVKATTSPVIAQIASTTASTSPQSPVIASSAPLQPEVKGIEITSEQIDVPTQSLFIAVKDSEAETASVTEVTPDKTNAVKAPTNSLERAVLRFPIALNGAYGILAMLVTIGLILLLAVEMKHRKPKLILMAIMLLALLSSAIFINSSTTMYALTAMIQ